MLNGVGLGANQTGRKRSRAGRPLHTCVALCNTISYKTVLDLHTCVVLCNTVQFTYSKLSFEYPCIHALNCSALYHCRYIHAMHYIVLQGDPCIRALHCSTLYLKMSCKNPCIHALHCAAVHLTRLNWICIHALHIHKTVL